MKKRIFIGFLFSYGLVLVLHLGLSYFVYNYFSASNVNFAYALMALAFASLVFFTWRAVFFYLLPLSKYLDSAEKLGIKINYSMKNVSFSSNASNKFNYDNYFVGGLAGDGDLELNNQKIRIFHLYQRGDFFPQYFGSKIVTVLETDFENKSLSFIFRKALMGGFNLKDSNLMKGWQFWFFENMTAVKSNDLPNVEEQLPKNLFHELKSLPGENAILVQHGKIRLIHDGVLNKSEEITIFANSLHKMLNG